MKRVKSSRVCHVCLVVIVCFFSACQAPLKKRILPNQKLLQFTVNKFNQMVRWKHYAAAKRMVDHTVRSRTMILWERMRDVRNITGYRVRDISLQKEGKEAYPCFKCEYALYGMKL